MGRIGVWTTLQRVPTEKALRERSYRHCGKFRGEYCKEGLSEIRVESPKGTRPTAIVNYKYQRSSIVRSRHSESIYRFFMVVVMETGILAHRGMTKMCGSRLIVKAGWVDLIGSLDHLSIEDLHVTELRLLAYNYYRSSTESPSSPKQDFEDQVEYSNTCIQQRHRRLLRDQSA